MGKGRSPREREKRKAAGEDKVVAVCYNMFIFVRDSLERISEFLVDEF
jgi:hypothetical protein